MNFRQICESRSVVRASKSWSWGSFTKQTSSCAKNHIIYTFHKSSLTLSGEAWIWRRYTTLTLKSKCNIRSLEHRLIGSLQNKMGILVWFDRKTQKIDDMGATTIWTADELTHTHWEADRPGVVPEVVCTLVMMVEDNTVFHTFALLHHPNDLSNKNQN